MKKCKIITKYWWILLLLLLLVIPVGLNFLLGLEVKCKVIGEAKDWLGFWGSYAAMIGSTAMVILTYKSLLLNKKNFIDQEKRYNDQANRHILELSLARAQKCYEDICEKGKNLNQFGLHLKIFELITELRDNKPKGDIVKRLGKIMQEFKNYYEDFCSNNRFIESDKSKEYYECLKESYNSLYKYYDSILNLICARNDIPQNIETSDKKRQEDEITYVNSYIAVDEIKNEIKESGKNGYKIDTIKRIIDLYINKSRIEIFNYENQLTDCVNKVIHDVGEELTKCREKLGVRF